MQRSSRPEGRKARQCVLCRWNCASVSLESLRRPHARECEIWVRPPEIEDRLLPGHWEGDFIKGAGNQSSVGVLVERTSRLVLLAKMEDATAESALAGFSAKLNMAT